MVCPRCGSCNVELSRPGSALAWCHSCGNKYIVGACIVKSVRKMQVKDLVKDVRASELERKAEKAKKILECKMRELDRAKRVVAKLEQDLAEFKELDLEDVELCDYRY